MNNNIIPVSDLHKILAYDPSTGSITRRVSINHAKEGSVAGYVSKSGYRYIQLRNKAMLAHRIAWALHFNEWPSSSIDHINRIKHDNRICNLRLASSAENMRNIGILCTNTSGIKGVTWMRNRGKWRAGIGLGRKYHHIGVFTTKEEAAEAVVKARDEMHGEFGTSGEPVVL